METVSVDPEPLTTVERPNIIAIMNESWADYENFGTLSSLSESLTDSHPMPRRRDLFGHAYASVFGAGTSASEFEFLTGNSMAFLPLGQYPLPAVSGREQRIPCQHPAPAMGTTVLPCTPANAPPGSATRPTPGWASTTSSAARIMDVPSRPPEHGYISDAGPPLPRSSGSLSTRSREQPLFLFNVTIQNHGSYTVADYPAQVTSSPTSRVQYPMAEQYLTLANETDQAFQMLVDYFSHLGGAHHHPHVRRPPALGGTGVPGSGLQCGR